mmetsp:Transcript_24377/g.50255  ORF Transcript_24377/g.50255 Transcript_24377/m.50255 type:complete len:130 (+) Transcript_24377:4276-4665(+)
MKFLTVKDPKLFDECHSSWNFGYPLKCIDRVGTSKAALIRRAFIHRGWLEWCSHHHPEQTTIFLTELKDPEGLTSSGLLPVRFKLGKAMAANIVSQFGKSYNDGHPHIPPPQIKELVGIPDETAAAEAK